MGSRTFHFVSFLYVFFFSFLFLLFRFFSHYFVFVFCVSFFFRFFSLLFSLFSFRFFSFRFFSFLFVFFRFSVYRYPQNHSMLRPGYRSVRVLDNKCTVGILRTYCHSICAEKKLVNTEFFASRKRTIMVMCRMHG